MPANVNWINPAGGDWNVATNWSTGALPGATDDVVIDVPNVNVTITHSSGTHTVASLTSNEAFTLSGGTLQVTGTAQVSSTFTISGGTLANATILAGPAGLSSSGGTLDGATLNGDASVSGTLTVKDGLTLNGTATIADGYNGLYFVGSQTLQGSGTVVFGNAAPYNTYYTGYNYLDTDSAGSTLTVGPGVTLRGKYAYLGGLYNTYTYGSPQVSGGPIINQGTIQPAARPLLDRDQPRSRGSGSAGLDGQGLSLQGRHAVLQ